MRVLRWTCSAAAALVMLNAQSPRRSASPAARPLAVGEQWPEQSVGETAAGVDRYHRHACCNRIARSRWIFLSGCAIGPNWRASNASRAETFRPPFRKRWIRSRPEHACHGQLRRCDEIATAVHDGSPAFGCRNRDDHSRERRNEVIGRVEHLPDMDGRRVRSRPPGARRPSPPIGSARLGAAPSGRDRACVPAQQLRLRHPGVMPLADFAQQFRRRPLLHHPRYRSWPPPA